MGWSIDGAESQGTNDPTWRSQARLLYSRQAHKRGIGPQGKGDKMEMVGSSCVVVVLTHRPVASQRPQTMPDSGGFKRTETLWQPSPHEASWEAAQWRRSSLVGVEEEVEVVWEPRPHDQQGGLGRGRDGAAPVSHGQLQHVELAHGLKKARAGHVNLPAQDDDEDVA